MPFGYLANNDEDIMADMTPLAGGRAQTAQEKRAAKAHSDMFAFVDKINKDKAALHDHDLDFGCVRVCA